MLGVAAGPLTLEAPSGQAIFLNINGTNETSINTSAYSPVTDNALTLGGASNRWSTAYAVNFIGTLSAFYNSGTEIGRITAFSTNMGFDTNAGATHAMALYTSGGVAVGTTPPSDPGANNLAVQANIKAVSYTVGSTAGASCTLTNVSHLTVVSGHRDSLQLKRPTMQFVMKEYDNA